MPVPKHAELYNPILQALKRLGGSANIAELEDEVIKTLNLTDEDIAQPHDERQTEVHYRLAWVRSYLKAYGLIENSARGVWSLTAKGKETEIVDPAYIVRYVKQSKANRRKQTQSTEAVADEAIAEIDMSEVAEAIREQTWREKLMVILLDMRPDAFERLCQRMLRESGFTQVKVTGKSGDGGIDGVGLVQLGGLLSFPVLFQCKRYQGSIGPGIIRDFRGAMIGRSDRGLVITTGTFSRDARLEATRDGAPPIDLVDGEQLVERLKDLRLGVEVKMIEDVTVKPDWFKEF
jgi:restriction system protein